jgi:cation-transporting ATPase 13A2
MFENPLKPETIPTMEKLNEAKLNSIIVTGDNALTAIKVA